MHDTTLSRLLGWKQFSCWGDAYSVDPGQTVAN